MELPGAAPGTAPLDYDQALGYRRYSITSQCKPDSRGRPRRAVVPLRFYFAAETSGLFETDTSEASATKVDLGQRLLTKGAAADKLPPPPLAPRSCHPPD
ncbi:hypothetical protein EVAR_43517_1 [Eumeta japonica]|uniref:Uncharacterized protein n=1 Tax=Eumeta variegata TaxID=151549 RepID=A0A4C1YGW2_EUMVA|nr:hypothetical protein EVAR_43517_1 [Eumeta japonica]